MHAAQPSLFRRPDTFFGACEALGQDFGFNANWLRVALGVVVLFNPMAAISAYLAIGVIVLASRLIFPARARRRAAEAPAVAVLPAAPQAAQIEREEPELAVAA
ncbi:hypothetical protein ACFB49_04100 [Sphingomonas sp. DBB INV C78]|uniref:PspC domain-containing protein n=1 Tax=Sphingomonas sp. DBB INV C78 TaxID=3349434 RepID=UPI0036D37030